ncbi:hypothetical protein AB0I51_08405 [Streptomyces sp. NPDC050549]
MTAIQPTQPPHAINSGSHLWTRRARTTNHTATATTASPMTAAIT